MTGDSFFTNLNPLESVIGSCGVCDEVSRTFLVPTLTGSCRPLGSFFDGDGCHVVSFIYRWLSSIIHSACLFFLSVQRPPSYLRPLVDRYHHPPGVGGDNAIHFKSEGTCYSAVS